MVMVMVIYSALVRSHQSTSLVASASCVPRGYSHITQDIIHALSRVPQDVEGLTRTPRSAPAPPIPCTLVQKVHVQMQQIDIEEDDRCPFQLLHSELAGADDRGPTPL